MKCQPAGGQFPSTPIDMGVFPHSFPVIMAHDRGPKDPFSHWSTSQQSYRASSSSSPANHLLSPISYHPQKTQKPVKNERDPAGADRNRQSSQSKSSGKYDSQGRGGGWVFGAGGEGEGLGEGERGKSWTLLHPPFIPAISPLPIPNFTLQIGAMCGKNQIPIS